MCLTQSLSPNLNRNENQILNLKSIRRIVAAGGMKPITVLITVKTVGFIEMHIVNRDIITGNDF
jgi:hypothetical protein